MNNSFIYSSEVQQARQAGQPVLALESTIIAHGMPYPENLEFARKAEALARELGVVPATIAILNGAVCVGLEADQLQRLATDRSVAKVATREIGLTLARRGDGATTVSAKMRLAHQAGINVFATGGIGGVHRGAELDLDISADLLELSRTPVIVVSAGAKAILDLPKTLEYLETSSVPVIGYQTDDFPAFYSRHSGLAIPERIDDPNEIAQAFAQQSRLGIPAGMLVANPLPEAYDIPFTEMDRYIQAASAEAKTHGMIGKKLTPFLLGRIVELTGGRSLETNRALALNNVELGAAIAAELVQFRPLLHTD